MNEPNAPSLRERQIRLGQDTILNVAFEQFCDQGYSKTTVQNIAEAAGVGPATVFRHFHSKLGILTALIQRELAPIFQDGEDIVANAPDEPVEAVVSLLANNLRLLDAPSKAIECEAYRNSQFNFSKLEITELTSYADHEAFTQIRSLIQIFSDSGKINPSLNLDHIATILFQMFNHLYYELERDPRSIREEKILEMAERVDVIFQPWLAD